ncbi:MAG: VanZ family protein [Candidatus Zixiibacteriota bacterium]
MKPPKLAARIGLLCALLAGLLLLLLIPNVPQGTHLWRELLDAGHAVLFGVLAAVLLWTARGHAGFASRSSLSQYLRVGFPLFLFGIATEIIQPYFQRDGEFIDVFRDTSGILAALCLIGSLEMPSTGPGGSPWSRIWLLRLAVVLLTVGVFETTGVWCLAYLHRNQAFPVLASFESRISRQFVRPHQSRCEPLVNHPNVPNSDWTGWGRIWFDKTEYPGITIDELRSGWNGFDSLAFELYSPLTVPISLGLRVEDRKHDYSYNDRFNQELAVKPGLNRYAFALATIESAPRLRKMNFDDMGKIWIFGLSPTDTFSIFIGPIALIR